MNSNINGGFEKFTKLLTDFNAKLNKLKLSLEKPSKLPTNFPK